MNSRIAAVLMMAILALSSSLFAGGKKEEKITVTFHLETEATDNPKMIFRHETNGQARYFYRSPEIFLKDVVSFRPFPSEVGEDYGIIFKLKSNAANRLNAITNLNQGRWMIAQFNGRMVDAVIIDKPISDGFIVIWKGIRLEDTQALDKQLPRIGEEGKKKK